MTDGIIFAGIGGIILLALVIVLVLVLRRSPRIDLGKSLERITSRLDQIDKISDQISGISDIFLIPRARGGLGETLLEELLANWLPKASYQTQFTFRDGTRADAVISLGKTMVAVDAKFPLESVKRDLEREGNSGEEVSGETRRAFRKHIRDISGKYIRPEEGTMHFALMYIPSEKIYYHFFVAGHSGLLEESLKQGVVPAGPGNLFLYLQTVAYGLRGFSISGNHRKLNTLIHQLKKDYIELHRCLEVTGGHTRNLTRSLDEVRKQTERIGSLAERFESPEGPP
ncbi:MAG: DNA recombination protein RmuC [Spirochaetia bacterium]